MGAGIGKVEIKKLNIESNVRLSSRFFKLSFLDSSLSRVSLPGQFLHIRISDSFDPLLRRPFSIHNVKGTRLEILYEVVGRGTEMLSVKVPGESLDVLGPLGHGFDYKEEKAISKQDILVGGGIGVAPLVFLAGRLKQPKELPFPGIRWLRLMS